MKKAILDPAYTQYPQEIINQLHSKLDYEGDNDYVQYNLPVIIKTERMFTSLKEGITPLKERAFTIANKARTAMDLGKYDDATKMAFHSLSIDPLCVDGWRILCKILNHICDGDTVICALREILFFSRQFYKEVFDKNDGMFYSIAYTRPYIRVLTDIALTAIQSDQLDVAIYAYEEMLRLNHQDCTGARNPLLACYLKIIGRIDRYPSTKPVRTIEHAEQLMNGQIGSETIWESNNLTVRWAKLCISYLRKENWQDLAKDEYAKNDLIFKVIFNEIEISTIPPENLSVFGNYLSDDKNDQVRFYGGMIKEAMKDWPDFLIELYKLIRGKVPQKYIDEVKSKAPNPESELTVAHKTQMQTIGNRFLDQGRSDLGNKKFDQAIKNFTFAKRGFFESAQPSRRWYLHAPFAIVSNRATAAILSGMWDLLRIDTRYTLIMKPDHARTYVRLPKLAEAFNAVQLYDEFRSLAKAVENNEIKTADQWASIAKRAIGLTSITAIAFAAAGILTEEKKEELIKVGIEDCYCAVNVSGDDYKLLPWLTPDDLEVNVPTV